MQQWGRMIIRSMRTCQNFFIKKTLTKSVMKGKLDYTKMTVYRFLEIKVNKKVKTQLEKKKKLTKIIQRMTKK